MSEWRKSSYSGYNGNCVEVAAQWRKSSYSVGNGACAEVAVLPARGAYAVAVRDSKNPGPVLEFSPGVWAEFLARVKAEPVPTKVPDLSGVPLAGLAGWRGPAFSSAI